MFEVNFFQIFSEYAGGLMKCGREVLGGVSHFTKVRTLPYQMILRC